MGLFRESGLRSLKLCVLILQFRSGSSLAFNEDIVEVPVAQIQEQFVQVDEVFFRDRPSERTVQQIEVVEVVQVSLSELVQQRIAEHVVNFPVPRQI